MDCTGFHCPSTGERDGRKVYLSNTSGEGGDGGPFVGTWTEGRNVGREDVGEPAGTGTRGGNLLPTLDSLFPPPLSLLFPPCYPCPFFLRLRVNVSHLRIILFFCVTVQVTGDIYNLVSYNRIRFGRIILKT